MSYKHLSLEERHYIEVERKRGESLNNIARSLGRAQSSISREVNRNRGLRGYRYQQANRISQSRQRYKPKAHKLTDPIQGLIDRYLQEDWSPEQIVGRLNREGIASLHHETVYQYILRDKKDGGELYRYLRHKHKPYRKRYGSANNRSSIKNRVDINQRPEVANKRGRIGDWEGDTIIGAKHQGAILTLDERRSKLRLAAPLAGKQAVPLREALVTLLDPIKAFVLTMTFDNGKEFSEHEFIAESLGCDAYFATPYHSWERGQNENANGLLRQYFPKKISLKNITEKEVQCAVHKLNSRPRKCLGFQTPYEAFMRETGINVENLVGYALMT